MDPRLNDCLPIIFEMLPQKDKFAFGQVCSQWREISFRYTKKLDLAEPFGTSIHTDAKLQYVLQNYRNLTTLCNLHIHSSTSTAAFAIIAHNCERIEELDIEVSAASGIREGSLALLANRCPKLKSFSALFCFCKHCDEDGFVSLVKHLKLERLNVAGFLGASTWLKHIHSPLRSLSLEETFLDCDDLIEGLKNVRYTLKELGFRGYPTLTEPELQTVMDLCPEVASVTFRDSETDDVDLLYGDWLLRSIPRWARLEELTLDVFTPLRDTFIESLVDGCPKLRKLSIDRFWDAAAYDELTETGLSQLARLKELTHLHLPRGPGALTLNITDGVLIALKNPKLKVLSVGGSHLSSHNFVTDHGCIELLANCPRLESLDIRNQSITTKTIRVARSILLADQNRPKLTIFAQGTDVIWKPWFLDSVLKKRLTVHLRYHYRSCDCDGDLDVFGYEWLWGSEGSNL